MSENQQVNIPATKGNFFGIKIVNLNYQHVTHHLPKIIKALNGDTPMGREEYNTLLQRRDRLEEISTRWQISQFTYDMTEDQPFYHIGPSAKDTYCLYAELPRQMSDGGYADFETEPRLGPGTWTFNFRYTPKSVNQTPQNQFKNAYNANYRHHGTYVLDNLGGVAIWDLKNNPVENFNSTKNVYDYTKSPSYPLGTSVFSVKVPEDNKPIHTFKLIQNHLGKTQAVSAHQTSKTITIQSDVSGPAKTWFHTPLTQVFYRYIDFDGTADIQGFALQNKDGVFLGDKTGKPIQPHHVLTQETGEVWNIYHRDTLLKNPNIYFPKSNRGPKSDQELSLVEVSGFYFDKSGPKRYLDHHVATSLIRGKL